MRREEVPSYDDAERAIEFEASGFAHGLALKASKLLARKLKAHRRQRSLVVELGIEREATPEDLRRVEELLGDEGLHHGERPWRQVQAALKPLEFVGDDAVRWSLLVHASPPKVIRTKRSE